MLPGLQLSRHRFHGQRRQRSFLESHEENRENDMDVQMRSLQLNW